MTTKFDRMATYHDRLLPMKSHNRFDPVVLQDQLKLLYLHY